MQTQLVSTFILGSLVVGVGSASGADLERLDDLALSTVHQSRRLIADVEHTFGDVAAVRRLSRDLTDIHDRAFDLHLLLWRNPGSPQIPAELRGLIVARQRADFGLRDLSAGAIGRTTGVVSRNGYDLTFASSHPAVHRMPEILRGFVDLSRSIAGLERGMQFLSHPIPPDQSPVPSPRFPYAP